MLDVYFEEEVEILVTDPAGFDEEAAFAAFEAHSVAVTKIEKSG